MISSDCNFTPSTNLASRKEKQSLVLFNLLNFTNTYYELLHLLGIPAGPARLVPLRRMAGAPKRSVDVEI